MLYDGLLLFALLFVLTGALILLKGPVIRGSPLYSLLVWGVAAFWFLWPWCHGGRTPGMSTWGLALRSADGGRVNCSQAIIRLLAALLSLAPLGLGFWWALWDREGLTWHDRLSGTRVVRGEG